MDELLAFALVAGVLTLVPGVDTFLVLRSAIIGGRRTGLGAGFGVISGLIVWGTASSLGVTALLMASQRAFVVLQLLGAAYLLWLGIQALRSAWRGDNRALDLAPGMSISGASPHCLCRNAWQWGRSSLVINRARHAPGCEKRPS